MGRVGELDGVRGLAILLVVAGHAGFFYLGHGGPVGVTVFFVLSGYLITGIIVGELNGTHWVDLRTFWARRARRIIPAVSLLAVAAIMLYIALGNTMGGAEAVWLMPLMDYWIASGGKPTITQHTWSLAVEEQFYLLWPIILLGLARIGRLRSGLVVLTVSLLAWRAAVAGLGHFEWAYYSLDGNAYALALGGLAAVIPVHVGRVGALTGFGVIIALSMTFWGLDVMVQGEPLAAFATAALILECRSLRWLAWRPLRGAGRVSYGWYLWHYPAVIVASGAAVGRWAGVANAVAVTVALGVAVLSWRVVERPILERGRRPRPTAAKLDTTGLLAHRSSSEESAQEGA